MSELQPSPNPPPVPSGQQISIAAGLVLLGLAGAGAWSVSSLGIDPATLVSSFDNAVGFFSRIVPLDFPAVDETVSLVVETLAIVFLATLLSVVLSVPVALAAARPTRMGRGSQWTARTFIVLARAIPDLVLAIVFLRMFGLGRLRASLPWASTRWA